MDNRFSRAVEVLVVGLIGGAAVCATVAGNVEAGGDTHPWNLAAWLCGVLAVVVFFCYWVLHPLVLRLDTWRSDERLRLNAVRATPARRSGVTVRSAKWWGNTEQGEGWADVRALLQEMLDRDGAIDKKVEWQWLGDPAYGYAKNLDIEYESAGVTLNVRLAELEQLVIP